MRFKGHRDEILEVVARICDEAVEKENGGAQNRDEDDEQGGQNQVEVRDELDARVQPAGDREGRHARYDDHQKDEHPVVDVPSGEEFETGRDLFDSEAERGGDSHERSHDRYDVDDVAELSVDAVAEDRAQRRTDRDRKASAVDGVGDRQADDHVNPPGVQAPVQEGLGHGLRGSVRGARRVRAGGGFAEM